jgi:preprotein translocase subunit SecE
MNMQIEHSSSVVDIVKLVFASLIIISSLSVFYIFSDISQVIRVSGLLLMFIAAFGLMYTTQLGRSFWSFALESKQEFKRISWPTKDEAVRTTLLVILMVFIVGLMLWLLDMFLFWGVQFLMSQGIK